MALRKNKVAVVGAGYCFILYSTGDLFGPFIATEGINDQNLTDRLLPPSSEYWLGTDDLGRDILSRIIHGARISLWVGFFSVIGSVVVGSILGYHCGYYGRWVDTIISRFLILCLHFLLFYWRLRLFLYLVRVLQNALIAIAIINVPNFGRLIRSKVLSIKEDEYITAAKGIGMKDARILFSHILPNSMAPVIVQGTLAIATAILEAAALGFLRTWCTSADAGMGKNVCGFKKLSTISPMDNDFPRSRNYAYCSWI